MKESNAQRLSELLNKATPGPWTLEDSGAVIAVLNARGEDVTGPAPRLEAIDDYLFIIEAYNSLPALLEDYNRLSDLVLNARICLECGKRMNRQLYCVKCDLEWSYETK